MIGKTISHYKITEKLGEGGMGVVYKAEDSKLKRPVALKFLSPELTRDAEAKKRFIHEARAASALQHTNICTIHAIDETEEGQLFICMDYYKGDTLKKKIEQRPLKLDDAINIAVQIAHGLAKAHETGIVHRDIKPANIIITDDGEVKIVDFGLVKLTGFTKLTRPGSTVGTTNYMSPEQLRGEKVDQRTDIWALGVVLYEIITGQLPFKGDYEQAISYAILNDEPEPLTALRSGVPLALENIVNKVMAKDPADRYQNIIELPVDLRNIETRPSGTSRITTTAVDVSKKKQQRLWIRSIPWITTVSLALLLIASLVYIWRFEPSDQISVKRTHINLPETAPLDPIGLTPFRAGQPALAISPDGTNLIYVANMDGQTNLYLRPMYGFEATQISGTQGAYAPFFSPDGQWVGFFAEDKLKKVDLAGGRPSTLCEVTIPVGASWGPDNRIFFTQQEATTLSWIFADGSSPGTFSTNTETLFPEILPGGQAILSQTWSNDIKIFFPDTEKEEIVLKGYSNPKYISTGHLLCQKDSRLVAIPFDLENLKVTGSPVTVIEEVRSETLGAVQSAISSEGTLVYLQGSYQGIGHLLWVNLRGVEEKLDFPAAEYTSFQISPNGQRLAITKKDTDGWDVWIYDLLSKNQTKLAVDGNNKNPIWTPDGNWITFTSDKDGYSNLYRKRVDSRGEIEQLTKNTNKYGSLVASSWSPDGKILAFDDQTSAPGIVLLEMDNNYTTRPFVKTKNEEWGPVFSPDGRWIAYTSDEQGKYNVYVQPYPQTGEQWRISSDSGLEPIWSPNTCEIFYWVSDEDVSKWKAVSYVDTPNFKHDTPQTLFQVDFLDINERGWDISPIDQRFLVLKAGKDYNKKYTRLNVVTNWFEELQRKMSQNN